MMNHIKIDATKNTPKVELNPEGKMIIQGRSIKEDPSTFYHSIIDWILQCKSDTFMLEMRLDYLNTGSSKLIFYMLNAIKKNFSRKKILIKWFYESDDEDMLDLGRDFESITNLPMIFYALQAEQAS